MIGLAKAIWGFVTTPLGGTIAAALAGVLALGIYRADAVNDGWNAAMAKITGANAVSRDAADRAQMDVLTCMGRWNREAGRCEP